MTEAKKQGWKAAWKKMQEDEKRRQEKCKVILPPIEHQDALEIYPPSFRNADSPDGLIHVSASVPVGKGYLEVRPDDTLWIADIWIVEWNRGQKYGTAVLGRIIDQARRDGFKRIAGEIAPQDWDRHEKLTRFYEKCGFTVELDVSRQAGKISLTL